MLEVRPAGELGLNVVGGGVAEVARGDEWVEGSGDTTGEEGLGETCSAAGLPAGRGEGLWRLE